MLVMRIACYFFLIYLMNIVTFAINLFMRRKLLKSVFVLGALKLKGYLPVSKLKE